MSESNQPDQADHSHETVEKTVVINTTGFYAKPGNEPPATDPSHETVEKTVVINTAGFYTKPGNEPPAADPSHETVEKTIVINTAGFSARPAKAEPIDRTVVFDTSIHTCDYIAKPERAEASQTEEKVSTEIFDCIASLDGLDDHFVKINDFASGGQGILSQGVEQTLQRRIAVKMLRPELSSDPKQCSDFLREARITAQLEHPAIIPIHSVHHYEGQQPAVMMKLINGENFRASLDRTIKEYNAVKGKVNASAEALALRSRLEIFLKVCDALEYAHSKNVMHCDLKPENIMIGKFHDTYLMDWGIAHPILSKDYDPDTWVPRTKVSGSLRYLAPESVRGEYSDQRADIYAMGLILFEIVALHPALPDGTQDEMLDAILAHEFSPLKHQFGCPIDRDMKAIIRKATEYDPKDRYMTIAELSGDVRRFMRRDEVAANPDNFFQKIFRSCVVHHGKALLITTLCCLLAFVGLGSAVLYYQLQFEHWSKLRGNTIDFAASACMDLAAQFDAEMTKVESNLVACSRELAYIMTGRINVNNKDDAVSAINALEYGKHPDSIKSYKFYPCYNASYDFDHTGYLTFKDTPPDKINTLVAYASSMQRPMQDVLLNSQFQKRLTLETREQLMKNLLNNEVSVNLVYFAFEDGFYMCYPGKSYKNGYDPRQRKWYQTRIDPKTPSAGWSTPYLNYGETGLVMTYSMCMCMGNGKDKPFGVSALDFDISKLSQFISAFGTEQREGGYGLLEIAVVDDSGSIVATSDSDLQKEVTNHYRESKTGGTEGYKYPCNRLIQVMKATKDAFGYWETEEDGRAIVYVFSRCRTLNWFFLGKLDLQKCMDYLEKTGEEEI